MRAELTPGEGASEALAIAHLGWAPGGSCQSLSGSTLRQSNLTDNRVQAIVGDGSSSGARGNNHAAYASLAGVYQHNGTESCWRLKQEQLDDNRVKAQTRGGVSLAALGVIRNATHDGNLYISQKSFTNNIVNATAGSGGTAVSSLTLAENCKCSIGSESACDSTAEPACKADCSLANVTLTQSGMKGNCLTVDEDSPLVNTSMDSSPVLSVSGGCRQFPLSISGTGSIQCTGPQVNGGFLTPADCLARACEDQTPSTQNPSEDDGTSTTPRGDSGDSGDSGDNFAALGSLALLLPASCGALMTIGVCAAYHKKRQQKAEYPVQDVMAMESRFVGAKAADQEPAAAEPSAVQWHKGDDQYDPESDEEASSIAKENIYEGVKDSPAAHF